MVAGLQRASFSPLCARSTRQGSLSIAVLRRRSGVGHGARVEGIATAHTQAARDAALALCRLPTANGDRKTSVRSVVTQASKHHWQYWYGEGAI